jgi:hypothetical protein
VLFVRGELADVGDDILKEGLARLAAATRGFEHRLTGNQQVTDVYLLGLAMHKKGKLATMDKGVSELLAERSLERELVVMI